MKQFFRKFVVGALSCLSILQACQTPNSNIVNIDNKNQSFNLKSVVNPCNIWQVRSFNNDDRQYVYVNGNIIFTNDLSFNQDSGLIDINQYLVQGYNIVSFQTDNECCLTHGTPHSWGYEVYKDGQIVFSDVQYNASVPMGVSHTNSYTINIPLVCPTPTPSPTSTPTSTPTPTATPTPYPTSSPSDSPYVSNCKGDIKKINNDIDSLNSTLNDLLTLSNFIQTNNQNNLSFSTNSLSDNKFSIKKVDECGLHTSCDDVMPAYDNLNLTQAELSQADKIVLEIGDIVLEQAAISAITLGLGNLASLSERALVYVLSKPAVKQFLIDSAELLNSKKLADNLCPIPSYAGQVANETSKAKSYLNDIFDKANNYIKSVGKSGAGGIKFPTPKDLAKKLGVSVDTFHKEIKQEILSDFRNLLKGTKNPDIGYNDLGNIVFKDPRTKTTITTDVLLSSYSR